MNIKMLATLTVFSIATSSLSSSELLKDEASKNPSMYESLAMFKAATDGDDNLVRHFLDKNDFPVDASLLSTYWVVAPQREVEKLLTVLDVILHPKAVEGHCTPLGQAARLGRISTTKLLLSRGASANPQHPLYAVLSPLHLAALGGHIKVSELLLANGALVNGEYSDGHTPLCYAALAERAEYLVWLLKHNANPFWHFEHLNKECKCPAIATLLSELQKGRTLYYGQHPHCGSDSAVRYLSKPLVQKIIKLWLNEVIQQSIPTV